MLTDSTTSNIGTNHNGKTDVPDKIKAKDTVTHEAASLGSGSKESLPKAPKNNQGAKETAMGAVVRFYQKSEDAELKAQRMVDELEEIVQQTLNATKKASGIVDDDVGGNGSHNRLDGKDNSKVGSDGVETDSGKESKISGEVKRHFYQLLLTTNPRLRHFIDDLTEEKAKIKIEKIVSEAKAETLAARQAVNKAQEEIAASKEAAKRAVLESQATQQAADLIVSQVKKDVLSQSASEISKSHAEVRAIQEAANAAVKRAEDEAKKSREEVVTLSDYVKETLALAQEKVKKSSEELKTCKAQAQAAIAQAQEEAKKARAQVEETRREAKTALGKVALESQQAKSEMELARRTLQEASVIAEKQAYEKFCVEAQQMRNEVDTVNKKAQELISKAQAESQQAKEELDAFKRKSEKELNEARKEALEAKKESEKAKQAIEAAVNQAREESLKAKEEAEQAIIKANEAIMQAKKDVINLTRNEISRTREALESPITVGELVVASKATDQKLNTDHIASQLHELRNPVHSISGFAKLMLEENVTDDKTRKEFLNIMVQQSESLNKLIDDMAQSLTKKDETFDISKETVSPDGIITETVESARGMAEQKKNLISYSSNAALPLIKADEFRIKQVVANLLDNAIKYSPEGSSIDVKAEANDNELLVQVTDYGIGISPADIPAIFDKSYRGNNRGNTEGNGLGLYICRQIVEAHGGRIWAESVEGEGSTFSFTLPLAAARQEKIHI
jgi:signal transduction histidine kinase